MPRYEFWSKIKSEISQRTIKKFFRKNDFSGIKDWSEEDKRRSKEIDNGFWFSICSKDLDLGKASTVEHTIKLKRLYTFQRKILQNTTTSVWRS